MSSIPIRSLEVIRETLSSIPGTGSSEQQFSAGEVLMREGERYDYISLVISGELRLTKRDEDGMDRRVGRVRPGQFLGLIQLSSGEPSFLTARAKADGSMLRFDRNTFTTLLYENEEFGELVGPLLLGNLVHRYRRVVQLHLKVSELTQDLEDEKKQLQATIRELKATRNQLIQQEKMATLGQLVAGIAHEINNPIASLSRAADSIEPQLDTLFSSPMDSGMASFLKQAFHAGLTRGTMQTESQRARIDELAARFPDLPRPVLRSLSQIEPDLFAGFEAAVARIPKANQTAVARRWMEIFEAGVLVRNMRVASKRIGNIVRSLKGYSRQDKAAEEEVDVREGLHDTLVLFGYALKKFSVEVDLPEIPVVHCNASELNQVWTNLILNACQAMGDRGRLRVSCGTIGDRMVWVNIQDSGPGVPEPLRRRIFEEGFSTKEARKAGGLGLGLAIAKGIVERHHGRIEVENVAEGGAAFTVFLPTASG
jgi:signal transduction histidine kinase